MKKIQILSVLIILLFGVLCFAKASWAANYYVMPAGVQYNGDGKGPALATYDGEPGKAWKGFSNIVWSPAGVKAGDFLYLVAGQVYTESLNPKSAGVLGNPITIS